MAEPFVWGMGGQKITTPEQAKRQRDIAAALLERAPSENWAEGLGSITAALASNSINDRASTAEEEGAARAGGLFSNLAINSDPNAIIAALTSPDSVWASPAQTSIASALLNQGLERQDPMYQLQLEQLQMQTDAMRNPVADPWAGTKVINDQIVNWGPEGPQAVGDFRSPEGESLVTVNTGTNNDFFSGLGAAEGEIFSGFLTGGQTAARNLGQIQQLEGLLASSPTGMEGAATQLAGEFGIDLGGASGVQAAQALINKMVPEQRQPGSGPMSDRDLEIFKASLPRIINQPGGNELIIDTLKAINAYDMELARITQEGLARAEQSNDPQQRAAIKEDMRAQINSLQNPVTPFRERVGSSPVGQQALPAGVTIRKISD